MKLDCLLPSALAAYALLYGASGCSGTPCQRLSTAILAEDDLEAAVVQVCAQLTTNPSDQKVCNDMAAAVNVSIGTLQNIYNTYCDGGVNLSPAAHKMLVTKDDFKKFFQEARTAKSTCAL
jgi:hypothetical protein